jgi:flagellar biosynthetic protein FliQ
MTPDMVAELLRELVKQAMVVAAPVLIAAMVLSSVLSLFQTLTSLQEQSLTSIPRLAAIALILLVGMPWFLERMASYTRLLLIDLRRYIG